MRWRRRRVAPAASESFALALRAAERPQGARCTREGATRLGRREAAVRVGRDSKGQSRGRRLTTQAAWRVAPRTAGGGAAGDTTGTSEASDEERSESREPSRLGLWKCSPQSNRSRTAEQLGFGYVYQITPNNATRLFINDHATAGNSHSRNRSKRGSTGYVRHEPLDERGSIGSISYTRASDARTLCI